MDRRPFQSPSDPTWTLWDREGWRIAGFEVRFGWTAWLVFVLVTCAAAGLLPSAAPGLGATVYLFAGVVAAVLLFAALLAHGLAHALAARRHGLAVARIDLGLFRGGTHLQAEPTSPRVEARVAAAGPAASLALGVTTAVAAGMLSLAGSPILLVVALDYATAANLLIGLFSLPPVVPVAPVDGGGLLRAWLWHRHRNRDRAAVTAARAGQGLGALMLAAGAALLLIDGRLGLWTAVVGGFLLLTATARLRTALCIAATRGLTVADLLPARPEPPTTVPAWHNVAAALAAHPIASTESVLVVCNGDGSPHGLVGVGQLAAVPSKWRQEVNVGALATPLKQITVTHPDEPLPALIRRLAIEPTAAGCFRRALSGPGAHVLVLAGGRTLALLGAGQLAMVRTRAAAAATVPTQRTTPCQSRWPTNARPGPPELPQPAPQGQRR
jgi:Zn-dependent protease